MGEMQIYITFHYHVSVAKAYDVELRKKRDGNSGTKSKFSIFVYTDIYLVF